MRNGLERSRHMGKWFTVIALVAWTAACGDDGSAAGAAAEKAGDAAEGADPVQEALAVATEYVDGYYEQFPEEAYESGYPADLDRLGDRSVAALAGWTVAEEAWIERLRAIDPDDLDGTEAAVPYAFALDRLESSVARRVCRTDLWNVSPTWTGWQNFFPGVFAQQPIGTEQARADALARARDVDRFLDTEIYNLRIGVEEGYTAPRSNVEAVVRQLDALLSVEPQDTPFYDPARRDEDEAFAVELRAVIADEIVPAAQRYRDYLAGEYI